MFVSNIQFNLKFQRNNFYKNLLPGFLSHSSSSMKIFFIRTTKSPVSQWRKNNKVNTSSESHVKNQTKKDGTNKKTHKYEQKCQCHTCSRTINSCICDSDFTSHNFPTDFINSLQWVKVFTSTHLQTEFLLQFQKQQEDLTILIASNKPLQYRHDKKTQTNKKGKRKSEGTDTKGRLWTSWELPTYKTQSKIIFKMPKAEIPNRNFFNRQPSNSL